MDGELGWLRGVTGGVMMGRGWGDVQLLLER